MKIKKFTAPTLKEVTEIMKKELGPNAIVLNTRKIPATGKLNFLNRQMFEITGAIDEAIPPRGSDAGNHSSSSFNNYLRNTQSEGEDMSVDSLKKVADHFEQRASRQRQERKEGDLHQQAALHTLQDEMADVKESLREISDHLRYVKMPALPEALKRSYVTLVDRGVDEQIAAELLQSVYAKLTDDQMADTSFVENVLLNNIADMVRTIETKSSSEVKPRVIVLVGPTGVGKTTTIAKIAAINKIFNKLNVGIISADTYRLGAIEQMRVFADVAEIPFEVVYTPEEMKIAMDKFKSKDVIYVDTVGRSQRNEKELHDLGELVNAAEPHEVHLVLNASTNDKTSAEMIRHFSTLSPNRLIISKLDEAALLGGIANVAREHSLPISFVTTGQVVPDDLLVPTPRQIASMIYSGKIDG
jgi:flagellar biosynthesis protein FlhF